MKVTYICHSSFLLEWDTSYWLFDYYKGALPQLNQDKELLIFVSHSHGDHYNPIIFSIGKNHPRTRYIISDDVKLGQSKRTTIGLSDEMFGTITFVKPDEKLEVILDSGEKVALHTLRSTDSGVAFLIEFLGKRIYHAGDLNWWVWKEETKQYNNNMTANFKAEMNKLTEVSIDIAFVPLDPRQEEMYALGMNELLKISHVKYVFPMHFWEDYSVIQNYKAEAFSTNYDTQFEEILAEGQVWQLNV